MSIDVEQEKIGNGKKPEPKQQHLEWRRNQVLELSAQGRTEREIAQILKVGNGTVHRDIAYLNKQAQNNLRHHLSEGLPAQYLKYHNGLTQVLKRAWDMIIMDSVNQTGKQQVLSLIADCYKHLMDLDTNGPYIQQALDYVNHKQEQLKTMEMIDERVKEMEELDGEQGGEEATTNGVF